MQSSITHSLITLASLSLITLSTAQTIIPSGNTTFSFTDTNGKDVSNLVSILTAPPPPSSSRSIKRDNTAVPLNTCLEPSSRFFNSYCVRSISPQAYVVACYPELDRAGSCKATEFCVDGIYYNGHNTAYCVGVETFVNIAQSGLSASSGASQDFTTVQGEQAVEVVMTGPQETDQITLVSLDIHAQSNPSGNTLFPTYGDLPKGVNSCKSCSSIGLQPIPDTTSRLRINAVFSAGFKGARMYTAGITGLS